MVIFGMCESEYLTAPVVRNNTVYFKDGGDLYVINLETKHN